MRVYKPQFIGTALGTREWSFTAWQRLRESRVESAAKLKADGVACLDGEKRKSHLNRLKAQIDAGTYHVDSCALAHKMLQAEQGNILKTDRERAQALNIYPSTALLHHF